jgi:hypothetical protein
MSEIMIIQFMAGLKTQTRRTRGLEKINDSPDEWTFCKVDGDKYIFTHQNGEDFEELKCPYGGVGDSLLFKEKYLLPSYQKEIPKKPVPVWYCADGKPTWGLWGPARPSMFMPIWASRHNPDIKHIGLARVNNISWDDALAEGVPDQDCFPMDAIWCPSCRGQGVHNALGDHMGVTEYDCTDCDTPTKRYKNLWELINGKKYPWSLNAWVWIIEFEKYEAGL